MEGSHVMSNLSTHNQSALLNTTDIKTSVYVFLPAGFNTKLVIILLFVTFGILGFVGNVLIYYFISRKRQRGPFITTFNPFIRNLNVYLKSLALSDILCSVIALPLICTQIMVDVFQHSWACRIVRFVNLLFPSITINNLIVISVERYLATRAVPRTFSASTVRKLVYGAWIIGFIVVLAPTAAINGIRYDLNDTHYTVVCKPDNSNLGFRVVGVGYSVVQHLLPSIILSCLNFSVAKTMWTRQKRRIDIQRDNGIRAAMRATAIRGTYLVVAVTIAFVVPFSGSLYYGVYVMLAKPSVDFQEDFLTRYLSAALLYTNGAVNFIIYVVEMENFRTFLKKLITCKRNEIHPNPAGDGIQPRAFAT